jgi:hypothetical protein
MILNNWKSKTLALLFITALLNLNSTAMLAAPVVETASNSSGELMAMGMVTVDGVLMMSGATIFSGSIIKTEEKAGAIISLGQLGRVELSPATILRLDFDKAGFMGQLETGRLRISLPSKAHGSIKTRDGLIVAHNEEAALFTIEVKESGTFISTQAGHVELRAFGRTQQIAAGQEALVGLSVNNLSSLNSAAQHPQNSSNNKLTALVIAISSGLAAVALIVTLHRNDIPQENFGGTVICCDSPTK